MEISLDLKYMYLTDRQTDRPIVFIDCNFRRCSEQIFKGNKFTSAITLFINYGLMEDRQIDQCSKFHGRHSCHLGNLTKFSVNKSLGLLHIFHKYQIVILIVLVSKHYPRTPETPPPARPEQFHYCTVLYSIKQKFTGSTIT